MLLVPGERLPADQRAGLARFQQGADPGGIPRAAEVFLDRRQTAQRPLAQTVVLGDIGQLRRRRGKERPGRGIGAVLPGG